MATSNLLQLLVYLLIGGAIVYVVYWIVGMLSIPPMVKNIILIVIAIVILVWLLRTFGLI